MAKVIDLVGQRFGRLVVVEEVGRNKHGGALWSCACDCGVAITISGNHLRRGTTKSCGCYQKDRAREGNVLHGMAGCREYGSYKNMRNRCTNPNNKYYYNYGGRGITVCEQWNTFEQFYKDMGPCPENFTLERMNNDGNYEPSNCIWASRVTQASNRRVKQNNTTGYIGVYRYSRNKWEARIGRGAVEHRLGYFDKLEDAVAARKAAECLLDKRQLGENSNVVRQSA